MAGLEAPAHLAALGHRRVPAVAAASRLRLPAEAARGARHQHRGGRTRRDAAAGVRRRQGRLALSGRYGRGFVAVPADAVELRGPLVLASPRRQFAVAVALALADDAQRVVNGRALCRERVLQYVLI